MNPDYHGDTVWNRRTFAKFLRVRGGVEEARSRVDACKPRENAEADWVTVRGTHEPMVPPAIFDRAQELSRVRRDKSTDRNFRLGSGLRSPFLLPGLVTRGRCGQRFQGRTVNSTKHRKDGTKIKTLYYCCSSFVAKGATACEKFLLRKEPLEELLLQTIQDRLQSLLAGEGETILRGFIEQEIAAQGQDPRRELAKMRDRIGEIDRKADVLLEGLSADTKGFVDAKLRDLGIERRKLQNRSDELAAAPYVPIAADAVLRDGFASMRDLPRLLESGSLEERKEFVRAFISGITVRPDEARLDLVINRLPSLNANSTVGLVAGARYEPLQIEMRPLNLYLAGLRRVA